MSETEKEKYLKSIYFDPKHPASFQNPRRLYNIVKKADKFKFSHREIKNWIQKQESYSRNKVVRRTFQRNRVIVSGIDDQFDADLASLIDYAKDNDGYKYLLCVIDIFSRYAWVEPLKDKTALQIVAAFKKILSKGRKPRRLRTDAATDFTSKQFQNFCKQQKIRHFTTNNEKQANYVERFIKTIKSKIFRAVIQRNNPRYIDILQDLVNSYNNTFHTGIKSEPINVNKDNESQLWWQMYWDDPSDENVKKDVKKKLKRLQFTFKVGDRVRMSHLRDPFQREYNMRWTAEIFKIITRFMRQKKPIYKLVDWFEKPVKGSFYQPELQKVDTSEKDFFKIERVIKWAGSGQNKKAFVSWKGWPSQFNSWVESSLIDDI